ncbi:hypothetical protein BX600DRAFT_556142 [Xylariales sp. PMI_506]|nr:hypothetical protein BX600DRAFT_556142 [Xylariales sp. PMI_506]
MANISHCQEGSFERCRKLPYEMQGELGSRVDKSLSLEDQWCSIWHLIFPDVKKPGSHTVDLGSGISEQVHGYQVFLENDGVKTIIEVLTENELLRVNNDDNESRDIFIVDALQETLQLLLPVWQSQRKTPRSISIPFRGAAHATGEGLNEPELVTELQSNESGPSQSGINDSMPIGGLEVNFD